MSDQNKVVLTDENKQKIQDALGARTQATFTHFFNIDWTRWDNDKELQKTVIQSVSNEIFGFYLDVQKVALGDAPEKTEVPPVV